VVKGDYMKHKRKHKKKDMTMIILLIITVLLIFTYLSIPDSRCIQYKSDGSTSIFNIAFDDSYNICKNWEDIPKMTHRSSQGEIQYEERRIIDYDPADIQDFDKIMDNMEDGIDDDYEE